MTLLGADTDALDKDAAAMTKSAEICDEVCKVCQAIVAASFFLGPFGAAFIAYLENTVIPWLKKISEALQMLAKVLSFHADAQRQASDASSLTSGALTALPSFVSTLGEVAAPIAALAALTGGTSPTTGDVSEEANPLADKSLVPGLREDSRGGLMDKELLREHLGSFTGDKESPWHVAVPLEENKAEGSLFETHGQNWNLELGEGKIADAAWGGVDDQGRPQVGGAVSGAVNAVDFTAHKAWELPGGNEFALQNQTTVGVHASADASVSYDPATASGSAGYGVDAFAGAQNVTSAGVESRWISDRVDVSAQYGVGYANVGNVEFAPGEVKVHLAEGLAWGPGLKVANTVDLHYDHIAEDVGDFARGLFGGSAAPAQPKR